MTTPAPATSLRQATATEQPAPPAERSGPPHSPARTRAPGQVLPAARGPAPAAPDSSRLATEETVCPDGRSDYDLSTALISAPDRVWPTVRPPDRRRLPPRPVPPGQASTSVAPARATRAAARLDANGTMWRLRSLIAMGHDATRIAHALRACPRAIRDLIGGDTATVTPELNDLARQLWDAWWDKRPPERTPAQRRSASQARHRAEHHGWCTPLGLDEDLLDQPGYRPYAIYRPASGTGTATSFRPASRPDRQETT